MKGHKTEYILEDLIEYYTYPCCNFLGGILIVYY